MIVRSLILFMFLLISPSIVFSQNLDPRAEPFHAVGKVRIISPIRDAPPHGPLSLFKGNVIRSTQLNEEVQIIGKKTYGGFEALHVWYQIIQMGDHRPATNQFWWVYGGKEGSAPQIEIRRVIN